MSISRQINGRHMTGGRAPQGGTLSLRVVIILIVALLALIGAQADALTDNSARVVPAAVETQSAPPAIWTRTEPASCVEPISKALRCDP